MNTYTKTLNVIDYSTMGLLSISAILAAANIPYALICFIVLWVLSIAIFITTSVKSGIYKESGSLFIYDLVIKIMIFASIEFWAQRDYVKDFLAHREIESKTHYVPLHMSPQGQRLGYRADDLMEASKCFETLLRLPVHGQMVGEQMEFVAGMVLKACGL